MDSLYCVIPASDAERMENPDWAVVNKQSGETVAVCDTETLAKAAAQAFETYELPKTMDAVLADLIRSLHGLRTRGLTTASVDSAILFVVELAVAYPDLEAPTVSGRPHGWAALMWEVGQYELKVEVNDEQLVILSDNRGGETSGKISAMTVVIDRFIRLYKQEQQE